MNIGIVLSKTPGYSETFFISKIKGLQDSGFQVVLFVQKKSKNFDLCEVVEAPKVFKRNLFFQFGSAVLVLFQLLYYPKRLFKFIVLEKKTNRSIQQLLKNSFNNAHILRADLDWLHFGFATMVLQSENVAEAIGAKMAVSLRGFDVDVYTLKHPDCYNLLWERVSKVHSISNYLLQSAFKLGLSKNTKSQIITPAIDRSQFNEINLNQNETFQFLTIGRLHWIKGISYTLEAIAALKRKGIKFKYTIIGEGSEFESIAFAIHQLQLTNEVRLMGKIPHHKIIDYLSTTDIYIQYSDSEGFCNAVLEAQAMKCLCVVSDGGALPENVVHEKTGWMVPKRNAMALAKTIEEVINLPEDIKSQIRAKARQRIIHEFNLEKQQKEFVEFYN